MVAVMPASVNGGLGSVSAARLVTSAPLSARWYTRTESTLPYHLSVQAPFHQTRPTSSLPLAFHSLTSVCAAVPWLVPLTYRRTVFAVSSYTPARCTHELFPAAAVESTWS